jgi:signal transduction histidine kinase
MNLCQEKGIVEIKVRDSGIGISEEGLKKLFKPYMQADKSI